MNIEQVTLDNGTTIGYGFNELGEPDFSVIEVYTGHEYVSISPKITLGETGFPSIQLEITHIDELPADEYDDYLETEFCEICGLPLAEHEDEDFSIV